MRCIKKPLQLFNFSVNISHILGFAVTVAIWPKEVVSCRDFILGSVATFWVMSLVGIYPGRASEIVCSSGWLHCMGSYHGMEEL